MGDCTNCDVACKIRCKKAELFELIEQQQILGARHQQLGQMVQKLHGELNELRQQEQQGVTQREQQVSPKAAAVTIRNDETGDIRCEKVTGPTVTLEENENVVGVIGKAAE